MGNTVNDQSGNKKKTLKTNDPFKALNDKIKYYLTEILTLKKIRDEQFNTITELRSENFNLKKKLKGE